MDGIAGNPRQVFNQVNGRNLFLLRSLVRERINSNYNIRFTFCQGKKFLIFLQSYNLLFNNELRYGKITF